MIAYRAILLVLALFATLIPAASMRADEPTNGHAMAGPVTLPPALTTLEQSHPLSGAWTGLTETGLPAVLVVQDATATGALNLGIGRAGEDWQDLSGTWDGLTLTLTLNATQWEGQIAPSGTLRLRADHGFQYLALSRTTLDAVRDPDWADDFHGGVETRLPGPSEADGTPTWLHSLIYAPPGPGPFPLAVLMHGATNSGGGADTDVVWTHRDLAETLVARGYLVAVPQRRGRGRSTGAYAEGLARAPEQGYSCTPRLAMDGFARAMEDMNAALRALRVRLDVDPKTPALLIGNSRGGALAHAWAGENPQATLAAISFAAGWVPETCPQATEINQSALAPARAFPGPSLRIYGSDDTLYGHDHTRALFDATRGADARYHMADIPWPDGGHDIITLQSLYVTPLASFLDALAASH